MTLKKWSVSVVAIALIIYFTLGAVALVSWWWGAVAGGVLAAIVATAIIWTWVSERKAERRGPL